MRTKGIVVLILVAGVAGAVGAYLLNELYFKERRAQEAFALGQGLEDQENYELAIEQYKTAYERFSGTDFGPDFLFRSAVCLRKQGKLEEAMKALHSFGEKHKDDALWPDVLAETGSCAEEMGDDVKAKECYETIKNEFPSSPRRADALAALGDMLVGQAKPAEASGMLSEVVEKFPGTKAADRAMDALGKANLQILFSPRPQELTTNYDVQKGESLEIIAKKFHTTVELIKDCNGLTNQWIRPGQTLKVVTSPFAIEVDLSDRTLTLYLGDKFFKRYKVGVGQYDSTPIGEFKIIDKVENPTWYPSGGGVYDPGDPENILGTRWLAINKSHYGIHGTTLPDSIGKASSAGCVRMLNRDVEELFMLVPIGTPVKIVD